MGFLCFFKKSKNLFLLKKTKNGLKKPRKTGGLDILKNGFFSTLIIFQSFFVIFP